MGEYTDYTRNLKCLLKNDSVWDEYIEPQCSVVILANNCEKKIERCLIKLIQQSYKNFEIIILDNSDDFTSGIISALRFDSRIKHIKVKEQNINFDIQEAIKFVNTDTILLLTPRDVLSKDCLKKFITRNDLKKLPAYNFYKNFCFEEFVRSV